MKKLPVLLFWGYVIVSCLYGSAFSQPVLKTMLRLPDTGQTSGYTVTFGEDNDYSINFPFYFDNGNGTVTDTMTGIMWQKNDGGEMTVENATIYCDSLTLGGYTDWRLPDCHELFSIFNLDRVNPALDTNYFTHTLAEYWWSSQRQANDSGKVWVTNAGGGVGNHPKTETLSAGGNKRFHVRAVRDLTTPPVYPNHFSDNGNGTTTDLLTGLMWQQIPYADSITWEQALTLADTSNYAGYSDWRLPNIKELQSINDEHLINPSVNQAFFSGVTTGHYWSSTSLPNQSNKAWYLDTHFGITTYQLKTGRLYALCARGGILSTGVFENISYECNMTIFPNPSTGIVNITGDFQLDELSILNSLGRLIYHSTPGSKNVQIAVQEKGIFFLTATGKGVQFKSRILILND